MENKSNTTLDIVKLIEKNPVTRLSKNYQGNLISKIQKKFTTNEQQLFAANFFCYLNYSKTDFVVEFNNVWKWIGFDRRNQAKKLLEKKFVEDVDYKISSLQSEEGKSIEQILMTVDTFKLFCLKANTKKTDEIHDCYIKYQDILFEIMDEETTELRDQLKLKDEEIEFKDAKVKIDHNNILSPEQLLEKQRNYLEKKRNDLEKRKEDFKNHKIRLDFLLSNLDNEEYRDEIEKFIKNTLSDTFKNVNREDIEKIMKVKI